MMRVLFIALMVALAVPVALAIISLLPGKPEPATPPPATPTSTPLRPVVETPVSFPVETTPIPTPAPPATPPTPMLLPAPPAVPGATTVAIGSVTLFPGERAKVPVWVNGVTDLRGLGAVDFQVTYNPAEIKVLGVSGGAPPFSNSPVYNVNKESGVLLFNNYHAAIPGPTGDILVAHLEVEALLTLNAATALHLSIRNLVNTNGDEIAAKTSSP